MNILETRNKQIRYLDELEIDQSLSRKLLPELRPDIP